MNKQVTLSASLIEPKDLLGEIGAAGMFLPTAPRNPDWWPNRGEDVHVVITDAQLLTHRLYMAISTMKQRLNQRGSSCVIEYKKEINK